MPDNQLQFTTRVDLSGLKSGMEEVKNSVQSTASASAQSVEEFSARARAATEAYNAAAKGTVAQQKALGEAFDAAGRSGATYVEALEQAVAATASLNVAEQAETNTLKGSMSARMAASAEMRVLEGNTMGSTRAAAAFLTTIPGIGAALQVAFPIFGAVALGEVIVDVGKKLYDAFDIGGERARALQEDIRNTTAEFNKMDLEIEVQTEKLAQEQAKLEKKPFNGMKLALDEASLAAQNLEDKLKDVQDQEVKTLQGFQQSIPQRAFTGTTGTHDEQVMLQEHQKWMGQAVSIQDSLNESVSFHAALVSRLTDLQGKQTQEQQIAADAAAAGNSARVNDYSKEIQGVEYLIDQQQREQKAIQDTIGLQNQTVSTQKTRDTHSTGNPDEKRLRAIETTFAQESAVHKKSAGEAAAFWSEYVNTFKVGTEQYLEVLDKYNAASEQNLNKGTLAKKQQEQNKTEGHAGGITSDEDAAELAKADKALDAWRTKTSEDLLETGQRWDEYHAAVAKGVEAQQRAAESIALANVKVEEQQGIITSVSAAQQEAAIHAASYAAEVKALTAELALLQVQMAKMHPGDEGYAGTQTKIQQTQNQITQVKGQAGASATTDNAAVANQISQPYVKGIDTINNAWLGMQNKLITGTHNISRQFANMGVSLLESVAASFEKMVVKAAESELKMVVAHRIANESKNQSDEQGAATAVTVSAASALKRVAHEAAVAAAGAWAAFAGIPIVGPVIGAVAAAATYVGVLALAAFDTGGIIPGSGAVPIMGHGGERVLTPSQTQTFEHFVSNMTSSSNTNNSRSVGVHQTFNGGSGNDAQFRQMMRRNATHVAKTVHTGLRQMGRA